MTGCLVLVGTPIGNLSDLSPRAVEALDSADFIACEDTRRTGKLLAYAGIVDRRLMTLNEHNESTRGADLIQRVVDGATVAVVTDAGMPAISDPGEALVAAAVEAGVPIEVVPGPTAGITALAVSGLATSRFVFEGFLPRKGAARRQRLDALAGEARTIVLYEAPHRLERTLGDLAETMGGDRRVVVARELTKLHEELWRGTLAAAVEWADQPRGEIVLVVDGAPPADDAGDRELTDALTVEIDGGSSRRDAVATVASSYQVSRRRVYDLAIALDRREPHG